MSDADTLHGQQLTAEEEAAWRAVAANNRGSLPGKKRPGANFLRRLFATLDASRAEAERLRELEAERLAARQRLFDRHQALRALAAELLGGLEAVTHAADVAMRREGGEAYADVEAAFALIAKAKAALGIGQPAPKGDAAQQEMQRGLARIAAGDFEIVEGE